MKSTPIRQLDELWREVKQGCVSDKDESVQ